MCDSCWYFDVFSYQILSKFLFETFYLQVIRLPISFFSFLPGTSCARIGYSGLSTVLATGEYESWIRLAVNLCLL
jgi:hypothetical protein